MRELAFRHNGRTIAGDLQVRVSTHGVYIAVGRFDGGVNFRLSDWRWFRHHRYVDTGFRRFVAGPFDVAYTRKDAVGA